MLNVSFKFARVQGLRMTSNMDAAKSIIDKKEDYITAFTIVVFRIDSLTHSINDAFAWLKLS